jgi:PTH1 family peptidyl-tRNA hydrolase
VKIVVGLGNPGPKYAGTRHNVGFEVVEYLAMAPAVSPWRSRFQSLVAEAKEAGEAVLLVKPETFMNLSGRAVRQVLDFYKLGPADLLVVSDDIALPLGKLRARAKGSHGGQNGLRDIQQQLGTDEYPRLRVGVGSPGGGDAADYVLGKFRPGERPTVDEAVAKAAQAVLAWARQGFDACSQLANAGEPRPKKDRPSNEQRRAKDDADAPPAGGSAAGPPSHSTKPERS